MTGYAGGNPEIKTLSSGMQVAKMSLGHTYKEKTTWVNVIAWDKQAEWLMKIKKGDHVCVVGRLEVSVNDKDGKSYTNVNVNVNSFGVIYKAEKEPALTNSFGEEIPF